MLSIRSRCPRSYPDRVTVVRAHHGTSRARAEEVARNGWTQSRNHYDWLGDGVYFFQEAPARARDWARRQHGDEAAVIVADVDLSDCMDLLDSSWFAVLTEAHELLLMHYRRLGRKLPVQRSLMHGLDRAVINYSVGVLADRGVVIRSVRGVFQEGRPAYPGSALFDLAHVQIAVRDQTAIRILGVQDGGTA